MAKRNPGKKAQYMIAIGKAAFLSAPPTSNIEICRVGTVTEDVTLSSRVVRAVSHSTSNRELASVRKR